MRLATHRPPGLVLTDHEFRVPLGHAAPDGEQITIFAREVVATGKEGADLPWLVFFQGGPGGKSPRPEALGGWLKRATDEYRVLLLDQRGTGRSTPANRQTLATRGDAAAQADYLAHFRADSIIRDAEAIRAELLGPGETWSIVGQSYGGFCVLSYLSLAPAGLRAAMLAGGLPPVDRPADDVYRLTYQRVRDKNAAYFARYPDDQAVAQAVVAYLEGHAVYLPDGSPLTPRRFQTLGKMLGRKNGFEGLHYLLEEVFVAGADGQTLSDTFLHSVMNATTFAGGPLYAVLHEAIYAQGEATRWAAERVRAEYPEFSLRPGEPVLLTGEMIYPWMFEIDPALQPLQAAAELLAQREDWPRLYDADRLRANTVPCAAAVYYDDMYVERSFSLETAATIRGCRVWLTNELEHDGIRSDGEMVMGRLIDMVRGAR